VIEAENKIQNKGWMKEFFRYNSRCSLFDISLQFLLSFHLKVGVVLVDRVVSEMHACIADILLCRLNILLCTHANQSIVKEIHP
jgi:hypothetical protein